METLKIMYQMPLAMAASEEVESDLERYYGEEQVTVINQIVSIR